MWDDFFADDIVCGMLTTKIKITVLIKPVLKNARCSVSHIYWVSDWRALNTLLKKETKGREVCQKQGLLNVALLKRPLISNLCGCIQLLFNTVPFFPFWKKADIVQISAQVWHSVEALFYQQDTELEYNLLTHKSSVQRALIRNSLKIQTHRQVCK